MQSNESSKSSRHTRSLLRHGSLRHSSHDVNSKTHTDSVESSNLPPPPPPPPRYPLKSDGFSPQTGYIISDASSEQTPKSPPRTSSLRPRGIPLRRESVVQAVKYGSSECQSLKKPQISSSSSNNESSDKQFPVVDRPARPFTLPTTTNTSTATTTTPSASSSNEKLSVSIAITKYKVDSLCQTDPRSTPLLSRLLAPGFATSVVSSTNNTNSSQRKGNNQSYESSEGDRSPVPSSSSAQGFLTEVNRQEVGLKDRILSQDVASSDKYQKKDSENVSWNLPSSSTHVQSTSREWRELSDWSGKRETIVQSKSRSPNFQPSPDSQCWRTVTSVQIKNENMLPEQSSSNTCSSGTQDEMESSVGSPGIFNRNQCDVESNNHAKMFGKGGGFLTNASSSGDLDDGGVDDDHAIHQTLPNEDIESNTHSDDHDDNDDEDVEDNIDNTDHDTTLPRDNEETVTIPLNHNNCNDDNNNSVTMMMMIHRTSHSYVNESEELFAVHEQQERQRQQQQEKVDYHHHHHQQQQQLDSKPSHLVSPNALQEPCDFEEGYPEYPNDISERTSNVDSRFIMPQPPPPPPPPYRIPDHFQPVDESVFNNNHPWIPPNYPYLYPQIPYPHYQHRFQSEKLHPMGQFVTSSVALTKSPALPVFDNPYDLLYMKQNYLPESLHRPPHPGALIPRRAICPQNQEGPPGIMKDDAFPPFTAISQALGFPIQWCYRGVCMLPRFPVTSASFTNLPVSCAAAAFVLTTTTSHICSLAAYGYNVCGRNNNQNQQFIGNYQPDICSVHIAGPYGKPELFSTSKSHIVLDTGLGGVKNLSELDIANLVKENQQLKQRLIDINIRLQYIDELEWHVQRLSLLVESMIVSHQRQCELDYQLQIYSPVSAPGGVVDSDGCKPRPPPPPNSLSLASSFGLTDQCPINQFHNMPANPGSLPAMPTNMTNCRAHAYTRQNVTRRVTQPNIIPPRFRSPHIIQPTQQLEKSEQRIHMANSTKRSLYPHSVASMNPRTVSLDRASLPRNTCTTFNDIDCSCIRCPLHEAFLPHSREHAYVNATKEGDVFSATNVAPLLNPKNQVYSPSFRRRHCSVRTAQIPLMDNAAHLLPHSGLLSCLPPQRILFAANPVCSNKPLSHPAIKITEENKRKHVSRESTQSISTGKYNRPTGLNFMTEKSEILDDSNMLLKHLSPHNEIRCVNTCTEVTSYQLTQCYPLCVVDRLPASGIDRNNNITSSGNPNQNNDEINTNSKDDSTNDDIFRSNTESTTTATLTVASIIATTATVITASPSSSISSASTNVTAINKQLREKSRLTQPRSTLPTSKLSRKPSTSMKQDNSSYSTNQQQRILRESSKRTKQANYGCGTTTPASSVSSRKKITSCSSESTSTRPLDKMTSTSSTSHTNKSSDNPDADYSGSYEGVSNSNSSHHSQSSEASSLEPDSTLSEGVLTRKCCPTKHSILQPKISTSSVKNQSSFSSSSSKVCINSDLHNPLQYSSPNKIDPSLPSPLHKNLNSSTDPSFTCLHTPVISTSASNLSSPIQDGRLSIIQESSFNSNNDNNNSNIIIPSVHINSPTSFTPCHSVDPNSILHPTSISSFNFARKPNMMIMTTSPCPGSHLPTPINHLGQPNHQTLTSNMYTAHRSMINIRPSVLSIPQKPSLQVHFAPPIRTNLCTTPTAAATTTTTNNNNSSNICSGMNKRMLLNPSFGSPVLSHPPLNQSSTINSIVSPNMLRKQYYYYE